MKSLMIATACLITLLSAGTVHSQDATQPAAFCFQSMWTMPARGFGLPAPEPGIKVCIPAKNAFTEPPPFVVRDLSLATPGDKLGKCRTMVPITGEAQGLVGSVRLTCQVEDTFFNTRIRWTDERFLMSELSVYLCGPQTSVSGSEFEKLLISRFGTPDITAQNRYAYAKPSYSMEVAPASINENVGAAARLCPSDMRIWKFEITAYEANDGRQPPYGLTQQQFKPGLSYQEFEAHIQSKRKGANSKFEKF